MGAPPNFDPNNPSSSRYDATATPNAGADAHADDVSFNRTETAAARQTGTNSRLSESASTSRATRHALDSGMHKAQDAIGQLQTKASELTSRIVDNINVDDLRTKVERQVREHPSRTLFLVAGAGYFLGRSLRLGR